MNRVPSSSDDRSTLHALWMLASDAWETSGELADVLKVSDSTVRMRDNQGSGVSLSDVRVALRRTAKHRPEIAAELVEGIARLFLDVRGRWVPEAAGEVGDVRDELGDVSIAHGRLAEAIRRGASVDEVARLARELDRESEEAGRAAIKAVR